jgi:hypothetical protein
MGKGNLPKTVREEEQSFTWRMTCGIVNPSSDKA